MINKNSISDLSKSFAKHNGHYNGLMEICTEPVSLDGYCLCLIFMRNPNGLWDFHNILRDQHLDKPSASTKII